MSLWSRIVNVFRSDRVNRDLDEELQLHIEEAIAEGRDPEEARRALGPALRLREESRDVKLFAWLDSLSADAVFSWRQMRKNRVATAAAIVSLGLAAGSCMAAFRLIDALLLRPLPVRDPHALHAVKYEYFDREGKKDFGDTFGYPQFRALRAAVKDDAELMAISYGYPNDLTFGTDDQTEKAVHQYVSGWAFQSFGLRPALGRLFTEADDLNPDAHPYAVISHDYWTRRFGRDPNIIGRTYRRSSRLYEIVGVMQEGFTGTEPGVFVDIWTPTMMNGRAIQSKSWGWFRILARVHSPAAKDRVQQKLQALFSAQRQDEVKDLPPASSEDRKRFLESRLSLEGAASGDSRMQKDYRRALWILGLLVALVLLIACVNVANLMAAQASARSREMALRVSIGAGRARLVQLVMIESAMIATLAAIAGAWISTWSAPYIVSRISDPENPARLVLPLDWRVVLFGAALTLAITMLFGIIPALRASGVKPMLVIRGGDNPFRRRRLMNSLVAAQVAFCFVVHFVAGLFVATFDRLATQPLGFSTARLLALETVAKERLDPAAWEQTAAKLASLPYVESVAICSWPLMSGSYWSSESNYYLRVSPGFLETMKIPLIEGRNFVSGENYPEVAIVNESFVKKHFNGQNPVGKTFDQSISPKKKVPVRIVGVMKDSKYGTMREPVRPTVFVPFRESIGPGKLQQSDWGTFMVRIRQDPPLAMVPALRQEIKSAHPGLRISNAHTQQGLADRHILRERLLAILSLFFAIVALILVAVGLYGVLTYTVLQRRREIGIRMALGADPADLARRVTTEILSMLLIGAGGGLAAGVASERYLETLLFQVRVLEPALLAVPVATILIASMLAAIPPVIRAVRLDPAQTLRAE
ncbi:MAG: ABC transporter permease [Bryobacterales bacterium]|nr:ABC transporter permease [Bryobacterales bacterium]